jgi:hypothetical protein
MSLPRVRNSIVVQLYWYWLSAVHNSSDSDSIVKVSDKCTIPAANQATTSIAPVHEWISKHCQLIEMVGLRDAAWQGRDGVRSRRRAKDVFKMEGKGWLMWFLKLNFWLWTWHST